MKIQAGRPARAACAATALARLPVEAQPTVSRPRPSAALSARRDDPVLEARARDGDTASFLTQTRATPSRRASAGDSSSGVKPLSSETTGSPSNGSHSR